MRVAIFGAPQEPQVAYVAALLRERGAEARVIDALAFPASPDIALDGDAVRVDGLAPEAFHAAYLRGLFASPVAYGVDVAAAMQENWRATMMAFREKGTFLTGLVSVMESRGVRMINPRASEACSVKPYQLELLRRAGVPVPDTLITNVPDEVRAFARRHARLIYKPVAGGATTRPLEAPDLTDERLEKLRASPVTFQEYIEGVNVRVYVVGDRVVASAIIHSTDDYDFRRAEGDAEPIALPDAVAEQCLRAARACGLVLTGIDIRRAGDRWVFLECNPSPMFEGFDRKANAGVGPALTNLLTS